MADDCSITYNFACETTPLSKAPDYPCPNGFYPYKNECYNPNQLSSDYDTAMVIKFVTKWPILDHLKCWVTHSVVYLPTYLPTYLQLYLQK